VKKWRKLWKMTEMIRYFFITVMVTIRITVTSYFFQRVTCNGVTSYFFKNNFPNPGRDDIASEEYTWFISRFRLWIREINRLITITGRTTNTLRMNSLVLRLTACLQPISCTTSSTDIIAISISLMIVRRNIHKLIWNAAVITRQD